MRIISNLKSMTCTVYGIFLNPSSLSIGVPQSDHVSDNLQMSRLIGLQACQAQAVIRIH